MKKNLRECDLGQECLKEFKLSNVYGAPKQGSSIKIVVRTN